MIKSLIKFAAVSVLSVCFAIVAAAQTFTDVPEEHWAYEQIKTFSEKGIVNGDGNGLFRPDDGVTREEFCKMLCETFGYYTVDTAKLTKATYSDVPSDRWSFKYVENCLDYLPGSENNGAKAFYPSAPALRDDLAAAVVKMMGYTEGVAGDKEYVKSVFTDGANVKEPLLPYVSIAVKKGVVNGYPDNTFRPEKGITRAEAVVLLGRAFEKYENDTVPFEELIEIIGDISPETERDKKIAYTIDGYNVTYAECDFQIYNYLLSIYSHYGVFINESKEFRAEIGKMVDASCNLYGTVYKIAKENNVGITMEEFRSTVSGTMKLLRLYYGENFEAVVTKQLKCTERFLLVNFLMTTYSTKLSEQRYAYGTPEYEAVIETVKDVYESSGSVRAKHILISFGEDADKAYSTANEVLAKAKSGTDFDTLIAAYNEDPGMSANPNGYVFSKGAMVEPFEKAAYALKDGEISGIVETEYGYHIIKRLPLISGDMSKDSLFKEYAKTEFSSWLSKEALKLPYSVVKAEAVDGTETEQPEQNSEEYKIDLLEYIKENFKK